MVAIAAFDEFLHDCRGLASFTALHATVCLIDDKVQPVAFFPDSIGQRLPDCIGTAITILRELR
jgi:hypothetical protein